MGIPQSCWTTKPLTRNSLMPRKPSRALRMLLEYQTVRSHNRRVVVPPKNTCDRCVRMTVMHRCLPSFSLSASVANKRSRHS
eukprot:914818-Pyramimonas_sp.AAC.1